MRCPLVGSTRKSMRGGGRASFRARHVIMDGARGLAGAVSHCGRAAFVVIFSPVLLN